MRGKCSLSRQDSIAYTALSEFTLNLHRRLMVNALKSYDTYTDNMLFQLIADGDEGAFEQLFFRYVPRIEPVIMNITGSEAILKDIVQEVFLQLWLNRHRLPEVKEPDNWIFKMVYNRTYSWKKKQLVRENYQQHAGINQTGTDNTNSHDEWQSFTETARLVQEAIHALSPQAKKIFQLKQAGLKTQEIAVKLEISVDGVKKSLYRSTQTIRAYLVDRGVYVPVLVFLWWLGKKN